MILAEQDIIFANQELTLNNYRAIYWKSKKTLLLSDLHVGKAAHFRRNGIAMPLQSTLKDLERLEQLIIHYAPAEVIVVGDLIHAGANSEVDLLKVFTSKHEGVKFTLVKGNHDRIAGGLWSQMGISEIHTQLELSGIVLSHDCIDDPQKQVIVGHIHPGVSLKMPSKGFLKFPCFWVNERQIILPAFSTFTGLDTKYVPDGATCYVVDANGIFKI